MSLDEPLPLKLPYGEAQLCGTRDNLDLAIKFAFHVEDHAAHSVLRVGVLPVPPRPGERRKVLANITVGSVEIDRPALRNLSAVHPRRAVPAVFRVMKWILSVLYPIAPLNTNSILSHW